MYKRNYEDPADYNYKVTSSMPPQEITSRNYHKLNENYEYHIQTYISKKGHYYGTMYNTSQNLNHDNKIIKD